jgi:hypothetical protein
VREVAAARITQLTCLNVMGARLARAPSAYQTDLVHQAERGARRTVSQLAAALIPDCSLTKAGRFVQDGPAGARSSVLLLACVCEERGSAAIGSRALLLKQQLGGQLARGGCTAVARPAVCLGCSHRLSREASS